MHLLQDARITSFIEGRWVSEDSEGKQMTIVGPSLPSSGDYSSYCLWSKLKGGLTGGEDGAYSDSAQQQPRFLE